MSKDIKKALEHCVEWNCDNCPNREELGSGEIVCRARLLPEILEYISDLQHRLEVAERATKLACEEMDDSGCVAICNYCPYNLQEICPNECPQSTILLEKYFKEQAEKEVRGE